MEDNRTEEARALASAKEARMKQFDELVERAGGLYEFGQMLDTVQRLGGLHTITERLTALEERLDHQGDAHATSYQGSSGSHIPHKTLEWMRNEVSLNSQFREGITSGVSGLGFNMRSLAALLGWPHP